MNLKHIYSTLKLLLEWLELGMYDFCSFPFVMKAHLREEDKEDLHNAISTGNLYPLTLYNFTMLNSHQGVKQEYCRN